jgi:hypothetical protein
MDFHKILEHIDSDMKHKYMDTSDMNGHNIGIPSHSSMDTFVFMVHLMILQ